MKVYIDTADWWIGLYRGPNHCYVCPLPTVVIRWDRREIRRLKRQFREAMATGQVQVLASGGEPLDGDRDEHQGTANNGTQHEGHSGG